MRTKNEYLNKQFEEIDSRTQDKDEVEKYNKEAEIIDYYTEQQNQEAKQTANVQR